MLNGNEISPAERRISESRTIISECLEPPKVTARAREHMIEFAKQYADGPVPRHVLDGFILRIYEALD